MYMSHASFVMTKLFKKKYIYHNYLSFFFYVPSLSITQF